MIVLYAKIIDIQNNSPSIKIELLAGENEKIHFHIPLFGIARGEPSFPYLKISQRNLLKNCNAQLYVEKVKWFFQKFLRVWEIKCKNTIISYNEFSKWHEKEIKIATWLKTTIFIFYILLILIIFLKERNK